MDNVNKVRKELLNFAVPEKAEFLPKFFQVFEGGYGAGDKFIGVTVPEQRKIARKYFKDISLAELEGLLKDPVHECRLTALFILINKFERSKDEDKKKIVEFYLKHTEYINNWDLVDSSAHKILGSYLIDKKKDILYKLAGSENLWEQRISIVATFFFIKNGIFEHTLKIISELMTHNHDLIHKASGWMLREVGKKDFEAEYNFLKKYYKKMPRTMLRYAIEKFKPDLRKKFLRGEI